MKYVFGAIGTILLLILVAVFVFNRDDGPANPADNAPKVTKLSDYADKDSSVELTTIGRLVGDEEHRSVRITVSANERRLEVLSGYNQDVLYSQTYPNTQAAYEVFLSGLAGMGFINAKKTDVTDQFSVCVTGQHYTYKVLEGGEEKSNLWSVSCNKTGSFNGRAGTIRDLFQRQIPEYSKQVQGVKL